MKNVQTIQLRLQTRIFTSMAKIRISELREIIQSVIEEDMTNFMRPQRPAAQPPPLPPGAPNARKAAPAPASAALPQKGALNKFKADVNMAVDAANRVKEHVDAANTKEALRWLDKVIQFATSAKGTLGVK